VTTRGAAWITGGGGGLGRAVAVRLRREGFEPVLSGRDETALSAAAREVGGTAAPADVTSREACERAARVAAARPGGMRVLVHAAGIAESGPLLPPDDLRFRRAFEVNALGAWHAITAAIPHLEAAGGGTVVAVASTASLRGFRFVAGYTASKHALLGLVRALVQDLKGSPVRVAAVCPGFLDTPMTERSVERLVREARMTPEAARTALARQNASGRLVAPDEVAEAVARLVADPHAHGMEVRIE
jgi:NAD(P)-dependent dehydrogenase (short-subunit alcohol dehydrogenase family)